MASEGAEALLRSEVQALCVTERGVAEGLVTLSGLAVDAALGRELQECRRHALNHLHELDALCARGDWAPDGAATPVLLGLQWETRKALSGRSPGALSDAVILASASKIAHLSVACYEAAERLARCLGDDEAACALGRCLDGERSIVERFRRLSEAADGHLAASCAKGEERANGSTRDAGRTRE